MAFSASEYLKMLLSLLPKGRAWSRSLDSTLYKLMDGLSKEFARIDARSDDLIKEQDPRKTIELLEDYENDFGLPDECSGLAFIVAERQLDVYAKFITEGGLNDQVYIDLADDLGWTITIDTFTPAWCGIAGAGDPCGGQSNIFYWQVNVEIDSANWIYAFAGQAQCGDQIIYAPGSSALKCIFNKLKPAHTVLLWAWSGFAFDTSFNNAFDSIPASDSAWYQGEFSVAFNNAFNIYYSDGAFSSDFDTSFNLGV